MKAIFLGAALVVLVAFLAWHQIRPKPPIALGPDPLDLLPVTDPQLYRPENLRRFKLNHTEYCAPRIGTLVVFIPKTTDDPLGAKVMLNPDSLTNFNQRPYRDGKPNPDWRNGMSIGISPAKEGWGFPSTVKMDIGKRLEEITEADFSSLSDIAREISLTHDVRLTDLRSRFALVKLGGIVVRLRWSPVGDIHLVYPLAEGTATGSLDTNSLYVERLESLFEIARNFFRPCDHAIP